MNQIMDNSDSSEETSLCKTCAHTTDCCDNYHSTEVKFAPLSEEVVKQLLRPISAKQFENLQRRYPNAKCAFIKHNMEDVTVLERKIRLIRAIIDGHIVIKESFVEVQQQMLQIGLDENYVGVFLTLESSDLCEENLLRLMKVVSDKRNDVTVIKEIQPAT